MRYLRTGILLFFSFAYWFVANAQVNGSSEGVSTGISPDSSGSSESHVCGKGTPTAMLKKNASFKGGSNGFGEFMKQNLIYPKFAVDNYVEGQVMVSFLVHLDGSVSDVKVLRSVHHLLDAEALRVIKSTSGQWEPVVLEDGTPTCSRVVLPVVFRLK